MAAPTLTILDPKTGREVAGLDAPPGAPLEFLLRVHKKAQFEVPGTGPETRCCLRAKVKVERGGSWEDAPGLWYSECDDDGVVHVHYGLPGDASGTWRFKAEARRDADPTCEGGISANDVVVQVSPGAQGFAPASTYFIPNPATGWVIIGLAAVGWWWFNRGAR